VEAGLGDHALGFAEPYHQREPRLVHGEECRITHDRGDHDDDRENAACETEPHCFAPVAGWRRLSSLSGNTGKTLCVPGVAAPASRMILSVPPNTRSIVSR